MMCKFINDKNIAFPKMQRFLQYRNNKIDILCLAFAIFTNMQYCKILFYACFFCFLCDFPNSLLSHLIYVKNVGCTLNIVVYCLLL